MISLDSQVSELKGISDKYNKLLNKLGIYTLKDFINYYPRTYVDTSKTSTINEILLNPLEKEYFLINIEVISFKNTYIKNRLSIQKALVKDQTGQIELKWFNQTYLSNTLKVNKNLLVQLKVKPRKNGLDFFPINIEAINKEDDKNLHLGGIIPEYNITKGISKKWFRKKISDLIGQLKNISISLGEELNLIDITNNDLKNSLSQTHFPESQEQLDKSVKQLSVIELTNLQLQIEAQRQSQKKLLKPLIEVNKFKDTINKFINEIPFKLTTDQTRIISTLNAKLQKGIRINDLIQGDVGSGKTIIAVYLGLLSYLNNHQTIILTPTTILASQHFETFSKYLNKWGVGIELVTGSIKNTKEKHILIGTSAVLARKHKLLSENVGFLIIDEQHRFGVKQRQELAETIIKNKQKTPHILNMSATPIPRTIAETFFGDLEVSTIKEKPIGRLPISTKLVPSNKRGDLYKWIRDKISATKEQVYWVAPLVEDSEKQDLQSVKSLYGEITKEFKDFSIGLLHGKMKNTEKSEVMEQFSSNKHSVLVSTTVIEVGVDISNATVLIIENSDRFGLAQLHQLRGRIGRNNKQCWCFLFESVDSSGNPTISQSARKRLDFFVKENDGLKIAEYDLIQRGPGEVYGTKQSGIPSLKIAKFNDIESIEEAKKNAQILYKNGIRNITLFSL